jgi:hypothetical protein
MTRAAALLLILSLPLASPGAPVPRDRKIPTYHPTQPGAKWVYRLYSTDDDKEGHDQVETVVSVVEPKGGGKGVKVAELGWVHEGKERSTGRYVAVSPKGLVEGYIALSGNFVTYSESLRAWAKPGDSWENEIGQGRVGRTERHTFRGEERVEVLAGKFDALRVDTEFLYNTGEKRVWKRWYAPGVGMVKLEESGHGSKVLKEFTLPK